MKMKMLEDRVLIKPILPEQRGLIVTPDTVDQKSKEGLVVSVGPGTLDRNGNVRPTGILEGERVLFSPYTPTQLKIDGELYLSLRADDVLGVLEDG